MMDAEEYRAWARREPPERVSVDGVVFKVGDTAWSARYCLTRFTITRAVLLSWSRYEGNAYASKTAAVAAMLSKARADLTRAKREAKRLTRNVERYKAMAKEAR